MGFAESSARRGCLGARCRRDVDRNVAALQTAIEWHRPNAVFIGHEVMSPYIAREVTARTGRRYTALAHGSATLLTVSKGPRYVPYARDGLLGAHRVVGGTAAVLRNAEAACATTLDNARVVNPGCDISLFRPRERRVGSTPTVGYVGKFIPMKGVHNVLAALGLTETADLNCQIVGFGSLEPALRDLADALRHGEPDRVEALADASEMPNVAEFVRSGGIDAEYRRRAREVPVEWLGRLEHSALRHVLPDFDVLVVASTQAEAFGVVAAEAAAAGVLPIVANHTGLAEVGAAVEKELSMPGLATFDPADPVRGIAGCIDEYFRLSTDERAEVSVRLTELARREWSWDVVTQRLLAVALEE